MTPWAVDPDIRAALIAQVRDLWTHGSTALKGNTLTLGETKFVIEEGLTVAGKPLKDHQAVAGCAAGRRSLSPGADAPLS